MDRYAPVYLVRIAGVSFTDTLGELGTRVVSLEHTELGDGGREVKVTVANPALDLLDDSRFQEGATIEWRFGYPDQLSDLYSAKVAAVEPTFDAYAGLTLAFYGYDAVVKTTGVTRQVTWTSQNVTLAENDDKITESEVVQQIAQSLGMNADVEPTKNYRTSFAQSDSDWAFMQSLTSSATAANEAKRQKYRLWFSADSNTLHFRPPMLDQPPVGVYRYYLETADPVLLSFSPKVDTGRPDAAGANTTEAKDVDGDGAITEGSATTAETDRAGLTAYVPPPDGVWRTDVPAGPNEVIEVPAAADPAADTPAESQAATTTAGKTLKQIEASLTVIGDPTVHANDIIEIRNVGLRFSGKYLVDQVVHTISGGYTTDLSLKRDGTDLQSDEDTGTSEEATGANTAESASPDDDQPAAIAVTSEVTGETEISTTNPDGSVVSEPAPRPAPTPTTEVTTLDVDAPGYSASDDEFFAYFSDPDLADYYQILQRMGATATISAHEMRLAEMLVTYPGDATLANAAVVYGVAVP